MGINCVGVIQTQRRFLVWSTIITRTNETLLVLYTPRSTECTWEGSKPKRICLYLIEDYKTHMFELFDYDEELIEIIRSQLLLAEC